MADSLATYELRQDAKPGGLCDSDTSEPCGDSIVALLTTLRGARAYQLRTQVANALDLLAEGCDSDEAICAWEAIVDLVREAQA